MIPPIIIQSSCSAMRQHNINPYTRYQNLSLSSHITRYPVIRLRCQISVNQCYVLLSQLSHWSRVWKSHGSPSACPYCRQVCEPAIASQRTLITVLSWSSCLTEARVCGKSFPGVMSSCSFVMSVSGLFVHGIAVGSIGLLPLLFVTSEGT